MRAPRPEPPVSSPRANSLLRSSPCAGYTSSEVTSTSVLRQTSGGSDWRCAPQGSPVYKYNRYRELAYSAAGDCSGGRVSTRGGDRRFGCGVVTTRILGAPSVECYSAWRSNPQRGSTGLGLSIATA